jgi:DinB superfamily
VLAARHPSLKVDHSQMPERYRKPLPPGSATSFANRDVNSRAGSVKLLDMIDFAAWRRGDRSLSDLCRGLSGEELARLTDEVSDSLIRLLKNASDADLSVDPQDAQAENGIGWTASHVIAHVTASSEESASHGLTLARGVEVAQRSRYETPWEDLSTVESCRNRVQESRRMQQAMLAAWPDRPRLDLTWTFNPQRVPPMNAIERVALGLGHCDGHLPQIADALRQAQRR